MNLEGDGEKDARPLQNIVPAVRPAAEKAKLPNYFLLFGLAALLVACVVAYHLGREYQAATVQWAARQNSLADDRGRMASEWLKERRNDAQALADRTQVIEALKLRAGAAEVRGTIPPAWERALERSLAQYARTYGYASVYVVNRWGRVVSQSEGASELDAAARAAARGTAKDAKPRAILLGDAPERFYLSSSAPVFAEEPGLPSGRASKRPLGAVVIHVQLARSLFPLLLTEGVPTRTGETLLAVREGNEITFIVPLRHFATGKTGFRRPYESARLAARAALDGRQIFGEFVDYRGARVLAATRRIPATGWGVVSKIDRAEALEGFRQTARTEVLAGFVLLAAFGGFLFAQRRHAESLAAARDIEAKKQAQIVLEAERQRFNDILEALPAYLILLTPDYHVSFANRFFRERFGESHGRRCYEYLFGRSEPCEICETYKVLKTGAPQRWEWTGPDGRNYDIYDFPFQDSDNSPLIMEMGIDITARQQAREALRQANAYNRSLIEASLDPLVTISPDGKITDVNEATEKVTGRSRQELIGTDFSDYFTEPGKARAGYQQVFREGWVQDYLLEIRHADGHATPVLYNATVYRDEDGKVIGVFAAARDISELQRAEEALRESEASLRKAQAIAHLGSWRLDIPSNRLAWSDEVYRIFGLSKRRELTYQDFLAMVHPEDRERVEKACADALQGVPYDVEHRILAGDRVKWVREVATVEFDEDNKPVREIGTVQDITERKEADEALRQSEERLRLAVEGARLGMWFWNIELNQLFFSSRCKQMFGFTEDQEVSYELFLSVLHPADREPTDRAVHRALDEHADYKVEYRAVWPDGTPHWIAALGRGAYNDGGEAVRMLGVAVDITDRKKAEEEVHRLNEELEQRVRERTAELEAANKELEAFTYSVSHDLRAPLRHVDGFSQLLLEEFGPQLPEGAQRHLARIQAGVRQMGRLVDDLLNLARIGRQEVRLQVAGLGSIVEQVISELKLEAGERAIDWKIASLPFVECDPALLKQVFANLLSNAVKFTRPRERAVIEVGAAAQNGQPVVFVRDNGVGFSMKYAGKLFGVFQRLHRAEDFEGTGVGLATVQRIIHKHGGRVWAEAELDQGATFYFTLGSSGQGESNPGEKEREMDHVAKSGNGNPAGGG